MDRLTKKEIIIVIAAIVMLWIGFSLLPAKEPAADEKPAVAVGADNAEPKRGNAAPGAQGNEKYHEKVIYTCRLASEEIPAVRIAEVLNSAGESTAVRA